MIAYSKAVGGALWELPNHNERPAVYRDDEGAVLVVVQRNAGESMILRHYGGEWCDPHKVPALVRRDLEALLRRGGALLSRGAA